MKKLDKDGSRMGPDGDYSSVRDIVQFVALNDALRRGDLAEQVLNEIP